MRDMSRRGFIQAQVGVAAALGLAACGGGGNSGSSGNGSGLSSGLSLAQLESKAKAEGGTLVYYTLGQDIADAQASAFKKKYPWVNFQTRVDNGRRTLTKVVQETQAKAATADVFVNTSGTMPLSIRKQVAAQDVLPNDASMTSTYVDTSKYGHPFYQNLQAMTYNTNVQKNLPTDIYEYADPKYKGKIAMDSPQNVAPSYFFLSCRRKDWGDDKWMQWLQGLKANDIFLTSSATSAYQDVVSGERQLAPDNADDVLAQKAGTPTAPSFYDGVPTQIFYLYRTQRAAHPYTAALFINWAMSSDGQHNIAGTGRSPIIDIDVPQAIGKIVPKGITLCSQSATNDFINNQDSYLAVYNKLWPVS